MPEPPWDWCESSPLAGLGLPIGEGLVDVLVELARRVIADVGDGDIGESQGRVAETGERDDESGRPDGRK